jgi:hypothetical protein
MRSVKQYKTPNNLLHNSMNFGLLKDNFSIGMIKPLLKHNIFHGYSLILERMIIK